MKQIEITYKHLYDLYVTKNMTQVEIAKILNVTSPTIGKLMIEAGIPARKAGRRAGKKRSKITA